MIDHNWEYKLIAKPSYEVDGVASKYCIMCAYYEEVWFSIEEYENWLGGSEGGEIPDEPPVSELEYCRNEAINNAQEIWKQLPEMGVREEFIDKYQYQYGSIITEMKAADSMEALQDSVMMFQKMIEEIMQNVEGEPNPDDPMPDYPYNCNHENVGYQVINEPTCTSDGYAVDLCYQCGMYLNDYYISALGHNYVYGKCELCGKMEAIRPEGFEISYSYYEAMYGYELIYEFYANGEIYAEMNDSESGRTESALANWYMTEEGIIEIVYEGKVVEQFTVSEDGCTVTPIDMPNGSDRPNDDQPGDSWGEDSEEIKPGYDDSWKPEDPYYCAHENYTECSVNDPTCVDYGSVVCVCDDCGITFENKIIPFGHIFGELTIIHEPTQDKHGEGKVTCERCMEVVTVPVIWDPNGEYYYCTHSETDLKVWYNSSCLDDGAGELYCVTCGEVVIYEYIIPATGHSWDYEVVIVPTPESEGFVRLYCQQCGFCQEYSISYEEWSGSAEEDFIGDSDSMVEFPAGKEEIYNDAINTNNAYAF
jgi:hypothetical protein